MRVLLADDHDLVRDAIKTYIEALDPAAVVETAATLDEALTVAECLHPYDLILRDWRMPGMNDGDGLRRMIRARPDVPVAILSGSAHRQTILTALDCGAASFIPKTLTGRRLMGVLELVISGETYVPVAAVTGEADETTADGRSDPGKAADLGLTPRESEVLAKLMAGLSNKEIARALGLQEVTVKLHMRGLFRKLNAKNRTQVVRTALDLGLAC